MESIDTSSSTDWLRWFIPVLLATFFLGILAGHFIPYVDF